MTKSLRVLSPSLAKPFMPFTRPSSQDQDQDQDQLQDKDQDQDQDRSSQDQDQDLIRLV